tara:strand:+ start:146 stop:1000 length:855 start_codon:yes stop_codon:yes gene_type:complete
MNILTFDIEEWFHILDNQSLENISKWDSFEYRLENNLEKILNLLLKKKIKATFFCLGWIAKKYPYLIKKIDNAGYEIGSHSNHHILAYKQNRNEFREDLKASLGCLEGLISKKIRYYRAPGFSLKERNKWILDELINNGIEIDCSIFPSKRAHGGFPNFPCNTPSYIEYNGKLIKEFPINTLSIFGKTFIFSGGGYFRILPYRFIKNFVKKSNYVMTYFHPRDFDKNQPIIKDLSIYRRYKSYVGIKNSFQKLEKLLSEFEFIDLQEANKKIDWEKSPIITLNY